MVAGGPQWYSMLVSRLQIWRSAVMEMFLLRFIWFGYLYISSHHIILIILIVLIILTWYDRLNCSSTIALLYDKYITVFFFKTETFPSWN